MNSWMRGQKFLEQKWCVLVLSRKLKRHCMFVYSPCIFSFHETPRPRWEVLFQCVSHTDEMGGTDFIRTLTLWSVPGDPSRGNLSKSQHIKLSREAAKNAWICEQLIMLIVVTPCFLCSAITVMLMNYTKMPSLVCFSVIIRLALWM